MVEAGVVCEVELPGRVEVVGPDVVGGIVVVLLPVEGGVVEFDVVGATAELDNEGAETDADAFGTVLVLVVLPGECGAVGEMPMGRLLWCKV